MWLITGVAMLLICLAMVAFFVAVAVALGPVLGTIAIVVGAAVVWYVVGDFVTWLVRGATASADPSWGSCLQKPEEVHDETAERQEDVPCSNIASPSSTGT